MVTHKMGLLCFKSKILQRNVAETLQKPLRNVTNDNNMGANYWIKLYHEILDDPKMGMLTDTIYRRCIELFLLAGRIDNAGNLPNTKEIAWMLRQNSETLQGELLHLESVGIIAQTETGWQVVNFEKRQSAITDAGRMKEYRKRLRENGESVTGGVTKRNSNVTTGVTKRNTDTDTDTDTDNINIADELPFTDEPIEEPIGAIAPPVKKSKGNGEIPSTPKKIVMAEFQNATSLNMPNRKSDISFWWSNIGEILAMCNGDVEQAKSLVRASVLKLKNDKLTISGPGSIVKTCRAMTVDKTIQTNSFGMRMSIG